MSELYTSLSTALVEAQQRGYAKIKLSLEIKNQDDSDKITQFASLTFGIPINFNAVQCQGISEIDRVDLKFAEQLGFELKLITKTQLKKNEIFITVEPMLVSNLCERSLFRESMNGVSIAEDLFDATILYGSDEENIQTASAILAKVINLAHGTKLDEYVGSTKKNFNRDEVTKMKYKHFNEGSGQYYLRLKVKNKVGMLGEVSSIFAEDDIDIRTLWSDKSQQNVANIVATTHTIASSKIQNILPKLQVLTGINHTVVIYQIFEYKRFNNFELN